jgi:hypothetical protein
MGMPRPAGHLATIRAHAAGIRDDGPEAIEQAGRALSLLPDDNLRLRGLAMSALGNGYRISGDERSDDGPGRGAGNIFERMWARVWRCKRDWAARAACYNLGWP